MQLTIISQTGELVNYSNITSIYPTDIEVEDTETSKTTPLSGIVAHTVSGEKLQLAIFETEEEFEKTWKELEKWLENGNYPIFRID